MESYTEFDYQRLSGETADLSRKQKKNKGNKLLFLMYDF